MFLVIALVFCILFLMALFIPDNRSIINGKTVILESDKVYSLHYNNLHKGKKLIWEWEVEEDRSESKTLVFWIEDENGNKTYEVEASKDKNSFTVPYTSNWTVSWENPFSGLSDGLFSVEFTYTLKIINEQPVALIETNVTNGTAPLTVSFSGRGVDYDGVITSYHWDFDDGTTSDEQNISHTFSKPGIYTVTLRVTDDNGDIGVDTIEIKVET